LSKKVHKVHEIVPQAQDSSENLGQHAVDTLLPRRQHYPKGLLQFVGAQA
jgi:hypothetical protein